MDSRTTRIVASVLVVALIALGAMIVTRGDDSPSEQADEGEPGWVLVDGWSWAMRGDRELEVLVDGDVVDAEFTPVTEADLSAILKLQPAAVTELAARVATADPSLTCDADGCRTAGGALELSELVAPTHPSLSEAGVTHGAYVARVGSAKSLTMEVRVVGSTRGARLNLRPDLGPPAEERGPVATDTGNGEILTVPPAGAIGEEVTAEDLADLAEEMGLEIPDLPDDLGSGPPPSLPGEEGLAPEIPVTPVDPALPGGPGKQPAPEGAGLETGVEDAEVRGATQDAPTNTGVDAPADAPADMPLEAAPDPRQPLPPVLVAGLAWGNMFPLQVPWLTDQQFPSAGSFGMPRDQLFPFVDGEVPEAAPFTAGLSADEPAAATLTSTQMTAWSSPLSGCSIGVVCAPTADGVEIIDSADPATVDLCYALAAPTGITLSEGSTMPELAAQVKVVLRDRTYSFDGAARTQLGAWSDDAVSDNSFWPVPATSSSEPFTLQVRSAEIYDNAGLVSVLGSQALTAADGTWDEAALLSSGASAVLRTC